MRRFTRRRGKLAAKPEPYNSASFIRIYLEKHHTQEMMIPPPFIERFNGEVPKKVFLKSSLGKTRDIQLEESCSMLFLRKGWEEFVIDNSLKDGEFLVFRYQENATFSVGVFGVDGSRKENKIPMSRRHPDPTTLQPEAAETVVEGTTTEAKNIRFVKVAPKKEHLLLIPRHVFELYDVVPPEINFPEMVRVSKQGGYSRSVAIYHWPDRVVLSSGWGDFRKTNGIKAGHEIEFEIILNKWSKIKELKLVRHSTSGVRSNSSCSG